MLIIFNLYCCFFEKKKKSQQRNVLNHHKTPIEFRDKVSIGSNLFTLKTLFFPQGCFFNTALITLGVEIITFGNYFGIGEFKLNKKKYSHNFQEE